MTSTSTIIENPVKYRVDGEAGRYMFDTHRIVDHGKVAYDVTHDHFIPLRNGREHYNTIGFKELALLNGCAEESYRKTSELINRIRFQPGATPYRTLCGMAESEGEKVQAHMAELASATLEKAGFDKESGAASSEFMVKGAVEALPSEEVAEAIARLEAPDEWKRAMLDNTVPYERADASTNVSIDDVLVKRQKEARAENENGATIKEESKKRVHNTVTHVEHDGKSYVFNTATTLVALKTLIAFLICNARLGGNIVFFVDGERSLRNGITGFFKWHSKIMIILDWHHLRKKCSEMLSMGLKGSKIRNNSLEKLMPLLWHGLLDEAIMYLNALDPAAIKSRESIDKLIGYFERNRGNIPCYSVRKELGLRNSSNRVEKANDILVAERQKNNGMSWSDSGSHALASICSLKSNGEAKVWFEDKTLRFKLAS